MSQSRSRSLKKGVLHSVPRFYGCYLLRSIPKPNSFYIGSTPDPVRRLRQHNGSLKAGAYRTKRKGFRPWEMVMIVYGFPSKSAALQFEHAWQHPYQTRHIEKSARITPSKLIGRSVHHKLGNARLLLNSPFFNRMNLKIQIFNSDTYKIWCTNKFGINLRNQLIYIDYVDAIQTDEELNMTNVVEFKEKQLAYDAEILTRFQDTLKFGERPCVICDKPIDYIQAENDYPLLALCYHDPCDQISHLSCMSEYFREQQALDEDEEGNDDRALQKLSQRIKISEIAKLPESDLIPKKGKCPSCDKTLIWTTLVRHSTIVRSSIGYDGKEPPVEEEEDEDVELELTQEG